MVREAFSRILSLSTISICQKQFSQHHFKSKLKPLKMSLYKLTDFVELFSSTICMVDLY